MGFSTSETAKYFCISTCAIVKAAKRGDFIWRDKSSANILSHSKKRRSHSEETKRKLSKIAIENGYGGKNYKNIQEYSGVRLESSYELKVAKKLDMNNINWIRPKRIRWVDSENKIRYYTPDFYLPNYDVYLDPKNDYLIKIDEDKIKRVMSQNCIRVIVLNKSSLDYNSIMMHIFIS